MGKIQLYSMATSNGKKVSIMLEECGLPYDVHKIDITKGDQFTPEFLAINPNGKIPAIVDPDGYGGEPMTVFESGAILIYLAEKTGKFLSSDPRTRMVTLQWLMFQMGGVGPIFGQTHHFLRMAKEDVPYAKERFSTETRRLYGVLNERLGKVEYLAGDDYSIADIATQPWTQRFEWQQVDLAEFPNVKRWYDAIDARPAVQKGSKIPA